MTASADLLAEAHRRGLLSPEYQTLYDEAVKRGLIAGDAPQGGVTAAFGAGVDTVQELGYRAVKGFTDVGERPDDYAEGSWGQALAQRIGQGGTLAQWAQAGIDRNVAEQRQYQPSVASYQDIDSLGDAGQYAAELVAGSIPYMASAISKPGAIAMAGGLSQQAYASQPEHDKSAAKAIASGAGQIALERIGIQRGIGPLTRQSTRQGVTQAAKRVGQSALWEGLTEAGQEALAQWGAGIPLGDIQGLDEAFVGGVTVGSVMRSGVETAHRVAQWQEKTKVVAKDGIDALMAQGMDRDEAIAQMRQQLTQAGIKQGMPEFMALATAARTLKQDFNVSDPIFSRLTEPRVATPLAPAPSSLKSATFSLQDESRKAAFIRQVQDKFYRLKLTQQHLQINDNNDTYLAEEAFHGKAAEAFRQLDKQYVEPIAKAMAADHLTQEEVDLFLMARHAPERNAYIDRINPELKGAGAGMTNAQAKAIMVKAEQEGKLAALNGVASQVDDMLAHNRQHMLRYGLLTPETAKRWQSQYQHYVPLRGYAVDEEQYRADGQQYRRSKGFNVKGKESLRALGRRSVAESPLLHAIDYAGNGIVRAYKNEVGNTFLRMVRDNPNPKLWQVFTKADPDLRRDTVKVDGRTRVAKVNMTDGEMRSQPNRYFTTKVNGVEHFIRIEDPLLLRAMSNLGVEEANLLTKSLGKATRALSSLATTWNPPFIATNFMRDVQTAVFALLAERDAVDGKIKDSKGIVGSAFTGIPWALNALRKGIRQNNFEGNLGPYLKEYLGAGAKTGWVNQRDITQLKQELQSTIKRSTSTASGLTRRAAHSVANLVRDYNDIVENGVRFSTYIAAREHGISVKQASSLAKNLTINFNRKGELSNTLNAFYMFSNASVQGSANVLRAVATPKDRSRALWDPQFYTAAQKLAAGLVVSTLAVANLMREIGGEDDDGVAYYDKIPEHVRANNYVLMLGGEDYVALPLPYGYSLFANIGHAIDSLNQGKPATEVGTDIVMSAVASFSPIGAQESSEALNGLVKTATPTVAKPFVEVALNENFYGGEIYPKQRGFGPKVTDAFLETPQTWEWVSRITQWASELTQGSKFVEGKIDVSPQALTHVAKFLGGGALQFASRLKTLASNAVADVPIKRQDIPFARRFYKTLNPNRTIAQFYQRYDQVAQYHAEWKALQGPARKSYGQRYRTQLKRYHQMRQVAMALRRLNQRMKSIKASSQPPSAKAAQLERIRAHKLEVVMALSRRQH